MSTPSQLLSDEQLAILAQQPLEKQQEILRKLKAARAGFAAKEARESMSGFTKYLWPQFIEGEHHRIMDDAFDRVIQGKCKRLIINMGPRHTKSEKASWLLPSKYLGHYPDRKIMHLGHTADLVKDFGRKVRDTINDDERYAKVFPGTQLKADTSAAGRWQTNQGGIYVAMGIGGKLAGKGADLLIIDDPHSEQEYMRSLGGDTAAFDEAYEWYQSGPRQRLQPGAAIVIVMTRWHKKDLTGRLIQRMTTEPGREDWEIIEFPAILPSGNPVWPEFWSLEELEATKAQLTPQQWNAQYLQNPTSEEGALVKREWWRIWEGGPPDCEFIIQSWDTAFSAKTTADYSACTTWGIFHIEDDDGWPRPQIILLDAFRGRYEFPELKRIAIKEYKRRTPDSFLIENKASGQSLIQELRRMGIPVTEFTPTRGEDKVTRLNTVTDLFASGVVWRPDARWAEEVVEEIAAFPSGENDDYVDSSTQALHRFRQGGFISLDSDFEDEEYLPPQKAAYY